MKAWAILTLFVALLTPEAARAAGTTLVVTSNGDPGSCSSVDPTMLPLRCAIMQANGDTGDRITFALPGCPSTPTACVITVTSALPPLTASDTTIDGTTESGWSANSSVPTAGSSDTAQIAVQIDGSGITATGTDGLTLDGNGDSVVGLAVTGFTGNALAVAGSGVMVNGNWLGVALNGAAAGNGGDGILIEGTSTGSTIGDGSTAGANAIANNVGNGVEIASGGTAALTTNFVSHNAKNGILVYGQVTAGQNSIANNGTDGVFVEGALPPGLSDDNFTGNTGYAVWFDTTPGPLLAADGTPLLNGLTASGNGHDGVGLGGWQPYNGTGSASVWSDPGIPFLVPNSPSSSLRIGPGAVLTLAAGTRLLFAPGAALVVQAASGATPGGVLNVAGTVSHPVIMSSASTSPQPSDWGGVAFLPGSGGVVSYLTEDYAGGWTSPPTMGTMGALYIDGANPTIANSTIANPSGLAVAVDGHGLPTMTDDTFTYCTTCFQGSNGSPMLNELAPVQYQDVPSTLAGVTGLTESGFGQDCITLLPWTSSTIYGPASGTWTTAGPGGTGLPLHVANVSELPSGKTIDIGPGTVTFSGTLAVDSGATLNVEGGAQLRFSKAASGSGITNAGTFNVNGTTSNPVVLTSASSPQSPGDWPGILFEPTGTGRIAYLHESYAGGCCLTTATGQQVNGGIYLDGASPTIVDSTFDTGAGIQAAGGAAPALRDDNFLMNGTGVVNNSWSAGQPQVDARWSYWGSPTGPTDPVGNPAGRGTRVGSGVQYAPWNAYPPLPLTAGWNALGMATAGYTTASSLVQDIQAQNAGVTVSIVATYLNGRYRLYLPGYSSDVALSPGTGVFVLMGGSGAWMPAGERTSNGAIGLVSGWNLIATGTTQAMTASAICSEIDSATSPGNCREVALLGASGYKTFTPGASSSDFSAGPDQGVMVLVGAEGSWTPS